MSGAMKARIAGRSNCESCLAMLIENEPPEYVDGVANACEQFALEIRKLQGKQPKEPEPEGLLVMGEHGAYAFEKQVIQFGVHKGKTYGDVPIEYLTWLADQAVELQSYLRSTRGKTRIETESEA